MASAMTFGNVIVYGTDPVHFQPGSQRGLYTLGYEEMQHTLPRTGFRSIIFSRAYSIWRGWFIIEW